ncbi:MAG: hypothetical protein KBT15_09690 [Bacteroidales bacterium]|nr:hypothetical protein [Candidatus Minthousia equi]
MRKYSVIIVRSFSVFFIIVSIVGALVNMQKLKDAWFMYALVLALGIILWFISYKIKPAMCSKCHKVKESDFKLLHTYEKGFVDFKDEKTNRTTSYQKVIREYKCPNCGNVIEREELIEIR